MLSVTIYRLATYVKERCRQSRVIVERGRAGVSRQYDAACANAQGSSARALTYAKVQKEGDLESALSRRRLAERGRLRVAGNVNRRVMLRMARATERALRVPSGRHND